MFLHLLGSISIVIICINYLINPFINTLSILMIVDPVNIIDLCFHYVLPLSAPGEDGLHYGEGDEIYS